MTLRSAVPGHRFDLAMSNVSPRPLYSCGLGEETGFRTFLSEPVTSRMERLNDDWASLNPMLAITGGALSRN